MRILVQFIGQALGLILLRQRNKSTGRTTSTWKMPLYPLPVILAITIWAWVFFSTGITIMISGVIVILLGLFAYNILHYRKK
jgi:amino acid transporter